jgi:hypothetical protein
MRPVDGGLFEEAWRDSAEVRREMIERLRHCRDQLRCSEADA